MLKILVINGPNLNLLGLREPALYGTGTYADLCREVEEYGRSIGAKVTSFQSNYEGALVEKIQQARGRYDGLILNPAAYTHTSIALLDALLAVGLPAVEVHLTDPDTREEFRRTSYIRAACLATVSGHGFAGYCMALDLLKKHQTEASR